MQLLAKIVFVASACAALSACSADDVQITITDRDLVAAIAGEPVEVPFIAKFSRIGDLDEERRAELDAVDDIVRDHIAVDVIEVEDEGYSTSVTIEGIIPLVFVQQGDVSTEGAWVVKISDTVGSAASAFPYSLQLTTGAAFGALAAKVSGINRMLSPDAVQPVRFRVRVQGASPLRAHAGGFQEGGVHHMLAELSIAPRENVTLIFKEGAYKSVGFLFSYAE